MRTAEERRQRHISKKNTSHKQGLSINSDRTFKSGSSLLQEHTINGQ